MGPLRGLGWAVKQCRVKGRGEKVEKSRKKLRKNLEKSKKIKKKIQKNTKLQVVVNDAALAN
jgi:hypothetical protein